MLAVNIPGPLERPHAARPGCVEKKFATDADVDSTVPWVPRRYVSGNWGSAARNTRAWRNDTGPCPAADATNGT